MLEFHNQLLLRNVWSCALLELTARLLVPDDVAHVLHAPSKTPENDRLGARQIECDPLTHMEPHVT